MQCEKFERRLHQVLDERGRPEDDPTLRRHADACPGCRGILAAQQALVIGLEQLEPPQLSADFATSVLRRFADESSSIAKSPLAVSRRRAIRRAAWATAAAALLMLAPAIYWSMRDAVSSSVPPAVAQEENVPVKAPSPESPQHPLEETPARIVVADAASPVEEAASMREAQYAELLDRWREQLAETSGRLGLTDADAPAVQGAAAVSQLTDRLRTPLSASIESTINVLRTALPSSNAEKSQSKPQARLNSFRTGNVA